MARSTQRTAPTVLFFTDNGHGLGHLTRLMAVARYARGRFQPLFLTMSTGYPLLREAEVPSEFFPSYSQVGLSKAEWTPLLTMRLSEVIRQAGIRVVVVDHVMPPDTFRTLQSSVTGVRIIWSRRGLWREGRNEEGLDMSGAFDLVVEPGDLAGPIDVGATAGEHNGVVRVGPIVLVQPDEYLARDEARSLLGLPIEGRAILLQFSDSNTDALRALIEHARQCILAEDDHIHLFAPLHPLHGQGLAAIEGVTMVPVYPVARYFRAFDGVVSMAGYNSFHEVVLSGLPAIFVARDSNSLDDQQRRAQFAELSGRAFWAPSLYDEEFRHSLRKLLLLDEPAIASATARELGPMTGAGEFADLVARLVDRERSNRLHVPDVILGGDTRRTVSLKIRSGRSIRDPGLSAEVFLIEAVWHDTGQLGDLAAEVAILQGRRPTFTPVFLVGEGSPQVLAEQDFLFESVMTPSEWALLGIDLDHRDYLRRRIEETCSRYGADHVLEMRPGQSVEEQVAAQDAIETSDGLTGAIGKSPSNKVETVSRSFSLLLPSLEPERETWLDVELPARFVVPTLLEEYGLAGYEASTLACWLAALSLPNPGSALDVGANVGPYAWLAAALTDRDVVAFEPVPDLLDAVAAVAQRNGLEIRRESLALTDRNGTATFYLSDHTDSSNSLVAGFRRSSESIEVAIRTLDSFVEETGIVPLALKIDTETNEPEVLAGGEVTLATHRPWLIVEVLAGRTEDRLMEILQPLDYFWYPIDDKSPLEKATEIVGDPTYAHTNWLLAPVPPTEDFWTTVSDWRIALRACTPR